MLIPSCQAVFGSPSIAAEGWKTRRSPTTDDAVAPVSVSGTDTTGADEVCGAPEARPEAVGAPEAEPDGTTASDGFELTADEAVPRSSEPPTTTATPTMTPSTPTTTSHLRIPPPPDVSPGVVVVV